MITLRIPNLESENAKILLKKKSFQKALYEVVKQNAVGLCYDLVKATLPIPKGNKLGGGTTKAFEAGMKGWVASVNKAYKPITKMWFAQWVMQRDWESVYAYKGFSFRKPRYQQYIRAHRNQSLWYVFSRSPNQDWGRMPGLKAYNDTDMAYIHKVALSKKTPSKAEVRYLRDYQKLQRLRNAANQTKIGFMAGGWLQCARKIGVEPDKYTDKIVPIWMYGRGVGNVRMTTNQIKIENPYADFGGWMATDGPQNVMMKRQVIMDKCVRDLIKEFTKK